MKRIATLNTLWSLSLASVAIAWGEEEFSASAALPYTSLEAGSTYELVVTIEMKGEITTRAPWMGGYGPNAVRAPLLQVDVPDSIELLAEQPEYGSGPIAMQRTLFRSPYTRRLASKQSSIAFTLLNEPREGEVIGLNLVVYLEGSTVRESGFVRRRIELPLRPGAVAAGVPSTASSWTGSSIDIGDKAPALRLPQLAGEPLALESYRGKTKVLLSVYRGHT